MKKRQFIARFHRSPRTQQEIKANIEKFRDISEEKICGRKRNLPTAYDDLPLRRQKSWKYLKRKTQYKTENNDSWHVFKYHWHELKQLRDLEEKLRTYRCFYEYIHSGIRWYGPELRKKYEQS